MKTYWPLIAIFVLFLTSCSSYKVYSVRDNPKFHVNGGVVYALPWTQVRVAVTVERRDLSSAPYASFATEMLGATATDTVTSFSIVDIDVSPVNVADPDYFYFVKVRKGSVTVDERHLLLAIGNTLPDNMSTNGGKPLGVANPVSHSTYYESDSRLQYNLYDRSDTFYTRFDTPGHPSLVSTKKDVRSLRQRAEMAAERIEELQNRRQELLSGESEGNQDAETMRFNLNSLRRQEQEVKALFLGVPHRETVYYYVDPAVRKSGDFTDTVAWFSSSEGLLNTDEASSSNSAFPLVCTIQSSRMLQGTSRFVRFHTSGAALSVSSNRTGKAASKSRARKTFRYRIPEQAFVSIMTPQFSVSRQMPISQFGPTVELPTRKIKALFDPQTLDLRELIIKR